MIASDLDGTLLTDSKELSQTTVQILDMAVKKGIYVIPATGRSFRAIPEQIRNYPGIRYVITSNGGAIYSVLENKRIYQCLLNGQTVEEALDIQVPENTAIELFCGWNPLFGRILCEVSGKIRGHGIWGKVCKGNKNTGKRYKSVCHGTQNGTGQYGIYLWGQSRQMHIGKTVKRLAF